jgi:hypothetical protein
MKWLVTLKANADLELTLTELKNLGCKIDSGRKPTPLAEGELVIQLEGPASLPQDAAQVPGVAKISPSSEMGYF